MSILIFLGPFASDDDDDAGFGFGLGYLGKQTKETTKEGG